MFVEKYVFSVNSSNLQDDANHHRTDPLAAAALADTVGAGIGSLLARAKYADGTIHRDFESGSANLARLIRAWYEAVAEKGRSRGWVKTATQWDMAASFTLYRRVAEKSLAHWMDGKCTDCHGTGVTVDRRFCVSCKGSGQAEVIAGEFEKRKILDMVSELEGLFQAHNARAANRLRNRE